MDVFSFLIEEVLIRIHFSGTITITRDVRTLYKHTFPYLESYNAMFPDYRLFL